MEFKSNAKYGEDPETGSVFNLKNNDLRISIHNFSGCGKMLFLSCGRLNIDVINLDTQDFNEAVRKAKEIINHEIGSLLEEFNKIKGDTEISLSRY